MTFDEMTKAAYHVMDHAKVPKFCFTGCAGVVLIKAKEEGFLFSKTDGGGLFFKKNKDGSWSNPMATKISSVGVGAVIGIAEKDIVIVLNHFAMEKFMTSDFKLDISVDLGAALGDYGASGEAAWAASNNARVAGSLVYAYQKGAIVNIEVAMGGVEIYSEANFQQYGTDHPEDILSGKKPPKDTAKAEEITKKFMDFIGKAE